MRVLICGSREWNDPFSIWCVLNGYKADEEGVTVISGMANGADSIAATWAKENGEELLKFPAYWKRDGKAAGPIRNQQMLDEGKPEIVWAFKSKPVSTGTDDMIRRAVKAGVPTNVVIRAAAESRSET